MQCNLTIWMDHINYVQIMRIFFRHFVDWLLWKVKSETSKEDCLAIPQSDYSI